VYVLQDETSISHEEIFGKQVTYTKTITESRGNKYLDLVFGKKKTEVPKVTKGPGMSAKTLHTYTELMREHFERQENERKRSNMRNQFKGKM